MQFEEVKKIITAEVLETYVQSVQNCASLQDLVAPTKKMLKNVAQIVIPEFQLKYVAVDMLEKILNDEEKKDNQTGKQQLMNQIRSLQRTLQTQTDETEQQVVQLMTKRDEIVECMKQEVKYFPKTFVENLNSKIEALKIQTGIIKVCQSVLLIEVEKLLEETSLRLSQAEVDKQKLALRLANPINPITQVQDKVYPAKRDLKFENYLVAIREAGPAFPEFNFIFRNGDASQFKNSCVLTENQLQPADVSVKRIVLWSHPSNDILYKIQLFGQDESKLLETGYSNDGCISHETVLEDDERIIGIRGRTHMNEYADYYDFQFVIGKLASD